jgi:hypothetical protein
MARIRKPLVQRLVNTINVFAGIEKAEALRELKLRQASKFQSTGYMPFQGKSSTKGNMSTNRDHAIDIERKA